MQIGDLVRYSEVLQGLEGLVGMVVDYNGDVNTTTGTVAAVEVRWCNGGRDGVTHQPQIELTEFLEVVSHANR